MTWRWLIEGAVLAMHGELIAEHGGSFGVRDAGLLASALARPRNQAVYGEPTVFDLAAAYAFGIIRIILSWMATSARDFSRPMSF
jgi:death-on-curing protein